MMLDDDDYLDSIHNIIRTESVNAEYAVATTGARSSATTITGSDASSSPSPWPESTRTRRSEISFTSAALAFI